MPTSYKVALDAVRKFLDRKAVVEVEDSRAWHHARGPLAVWVFDHDDPEHSLDWYYEVEDRFEETRGFVDRDDERWIHPTRRPFAAVGGRSFGDNNHAYLFFDLEREGCPVMIWDKDLDPGQMVDIAPSAAALGLKTG